MNRPCPLLCHLDLFVCHNLSYNQVMCLVGLASYLKCWHVVHRTKLALSPHATAYQPHSQFGSSPPTDPILTVGTPMTVGMRLRAQWLKGKSPPLTVRHCLILAP